MIKTEMQSILHGPALISIFLYFMILGAAIACVSAEIKTESTGSSLPAVVNTSNGAIKSVLSNADGVRLEGVWRDGKILLGPEYRPVNSQQPIEQIEFDKHTFRVVWQPFERYYDYWGTYNLDEQKKTIEFKIQAGNYIPKDFVGKGTYSFTDQGRLILKDVWFGSMHRRPVTNDFRGHILVSQISCKTTSIHEAAVRGQIDFLQQLIAGGADVNQKDQGGRTPLQLAASQGQAAAVRFLCAHGAETDVRSPGGLTALHLAAISGGFDVCAALIEAGADLGARDFGSNTPLHSLLSRYRPFDIEKTVELLINHGSNIHDSGLLWLVAEYGSTNVMGIFLRHGADINSKEQENLTALHHAASKNRVEMVQFLLNNGADVNAVGGYANRTPLHECIGTPSLDNEDKIPVVKMLLDRGANINAKDTSDTTPLQLAAWFMEKDVVEYLLDKGADLKTKGGWAKRTPLHDAADGDDRKLPVVKLLIMRGAEVNELDLNGKTPLHLAVQNNAVGIVQTLIEHGAHVLVEDDAGKSPLFIAESQKQDQIIAMLKAASLHEKITPKEEPAVVSTIDANQTDQISVAGSGFTPTWNSAQFRDVSNPDKIFDITELPSDGKTLVVPIDEKIPAGTYFLKVGAFRALQQKL